MVVPLVSFFMVPLLVRAHITMVVPLKSFLWYRSRITHSVPPFQADTSSSISQEVDSAGAWSSPERSGGGGQAPAERHRQ